MSIDTKKELESYKTLRGERRDPFTADTITQIYDGARADGSLDVCRAIADALMIGYSVGFKASERSMR